MRDLVRPVRGPASVLQPLVLTVFASVAVIPLHRLSYDGTNVLSLNTQRHSYRHGHTRQSG